jgi:hypothetical protein
MHEKILKAWRSQNPRLVKQMQADGELEEALNETAQSIGQTYESLWKQGVQQNEAMELAWAAWIELPTSEV